MNSPSERGAVGRVYEDIKNRILSGEIRLRQRLDVDDLARTYRVSGTPVRQALSYLAFERLIAPHPVRGFHVVLWSEKGLRDLYLWRGMLACLAAETCERIAPDSVQNGPGSYPDAAAALLQCLDANSNSELARAAVNADERLRAARLIEPELIPESSAELSAITAGMVDGTLDQLKSVLRGYHHRRAELAAEIRARALLRALPEDDD